MSVRWYPISRFRSTGVHTEIAFVWQSSMLGRHGSKGGLPRTPLTSFDGPRGHSGHRIASPWWCRRAQEKCAWWPHAQDSRIELRWRAAEHTEQSPWTATWRNSSLHTAAVAG